MIRSVEVVWWHRKPGLGIGQMGTAPRQTDICLLEQHAEEPNESYDNEDDMRRMLAIKHLGNPRMANQIFIDSVTSICNCQPHPDACQYEDEFEGRRFKLRDGSRIGNMTIWENVPNSDEGYPNRKIAVENVKKAWAEMCLAAIIDKEGHR